MPDLITVGRVSLDLFSRDIGAPFAQINSFETSVGGSPVNIAIGASRLGLRALAFTAVGDDEVGRFVRHYLAREGVDTAHIAVKAGRRTGMAVVGVQPPDKFPLLFYRENPADIHLSLDDAQTLPLNEARALQLSGTAMSRGGAADATVYLAEQAQMLNATTFLDLDLRPDQWTHKLAYGLRMRRLLPLCDVVIGTEEEFYAALAPDPSVVMAGGTAPDKGELENLLDETAKKHPATLIVKRGADGVSIVQQRARMDAPGFPVPVVNTVGAGDGFASGLICGWARGWGWQRAARFGNACGALVVSRQGCARALPTLLEVEEFLARYP
ncbi:MAG: 5-dehydro-2-deoxygluconokinase [Chloroflexi bacterium]|nr:5-dehydro-2-deoxygluconokinase [Chloroflexota bacterium]MCY4246491.1 5-dehydro-2-deoxygluconokinase [Chloroflexota bacterium]